MSMYDDFAKIIDEARATGRTTRPYLLFSNILLRDKDVWAELRQFGKDNGLRVDSIKEGKGKKEVLLVVFEPIRTRTQ